MIYAKTNSAASTRIIKIKQKRIARRENPEKLDLIIADVINRFFFSLLCKNYSQFEKHQPEVITSTAIVLQIKKQKEMNLLIEILITLALVKTVCMRECFTLEIIKVN